MLTALAVGLVATACIRLSSPSFRVVDAVVDLGPVALDPDRPGAEVAVGVELDPAVGWNERTITVGLGGGPDRPVLVELLDQGGRRLAAGVVGARSRAPATELLQECRQSCEGPIAVRLRSVPDPDRRSDPSTRTSSTTPHTTAGAPSAAVDETAAEVRAEVRVSARAYADRDPVPPRLTPGPPELLDGGQLQDRAALGPPVTTAVDAATAVGGHRVAMAADACAGGDPWLVTWPPGRDGDDGPQLRVVTTDDVPVAPGRAVAVSSACGDGAPSGFWVVLAAPASGQERQEPSVTWAVLGQSPANTGRIEPAQVTVSRSPPVSLADGPVRVEVAVPPASPDGGTLRLAEGIDDTGGTSAELPGVDPFDVEPPASAPRPDTGRGPSGTWSRPWAGTGFAPVVAGPCPPADCPDPVVVSLRYRLAPGPRQGRLAARAVVWTLRSPGPG